jgi:hypothetical protein
MDHPVAMNVFYPCQDLLEVAIGLTVTQPFAADNVVEQLSTFRVLHDEVDI